MRTTFGMKKLVDVSRIRINCSDCGRERFWSQDDIRQRGLPGDATINDLGNTLYCKSCRSQGGYGYNVEIYSAPATDGYRRVG